MLSYLGKKYFSKSTKIAKFFPVKQTPSKEPFYPVQHPKSLESTNQEIISFQKPPSYITPPREVPHELYKPANTPFESPAYSKALDICLIGAPNVGKSSLINRIVREEISAVSNKANTTDEAIKGIYTNIEKKTQIVFYDTPGIIQVYKNTSHFITRAWDVVSNCDRALFVVDAVKRMDDSIKEAILRLKRMKLDEAYRNKMKLLKAGEDEALENISSDPNSIENKSFGDQTIPTYLVVNKIDLCTNKRKLKWLINELEDIGKFEKIFYTSAETGYGISELVEALEAEAYQRPWEYNPALKSEFTEVEKIEQIVKSVIFERFYYELPFMIGIMLTEFRIRSDGVFKLEFALEVNSASQVPIVIGYKGRNLKYIKEHVTHKLVTLYQKEVIVSFIVKHKDESLLAANERVQEIVDPNKILSETKREIELLKKGKISLQDIKR